MFSKALHNRWLRLCVSRGWGPGTFAPLFRLLNAADCLLYEHGGKAC